MQIAGNRILDKRYRRNDMINSAQPEIRQELPSVEDYLALRQEAGLSPMSIEGLPPDCLTLLLR